MEVRENTPEYETYRTLVNHLIEGLAVYKFDKYVTKSIYFL